MNSARTVHTLDLNFQGYKKAIAAYLIPHSEGAVLIECGPGSTIPELEASLAEYQLNPGDITDVLLTHIHLDHAGNAGWLARQGAHIHVHNIGAPHLINPERLLSSATRIYGDKMNELWGEFLPVPEEQLSSLEDGDVIEINQIVFQAIDTPGHAYHHLAYLLDDLCFTGDVGGVRIPTDGPRHIRIPMPPPELNLELWKESIKILQTKEISRIAPTHFGIYPDPDWHLQNVLDEIDQAESWMFEIMPQGYSIEHLREKFLKWTTEKSLQAGLDLSTLDPFEKANPSGMSADGIKRYWEKHVLNE